ncbi:hypothetical protein [Piscinibacter sp.]|uniref:hypothetical protein n=1 Tax=Piscinibacter sp. TaxID=1903157 RepID=UPI0039E3F341
MIGALLRVLGRYVAQPDKALHVLAAFVLTFLLMAGGMPVLAAAWLCLAVAWGKERWDKAHAEGHTWDGWDAFATVLGGLAGITLWQLIAPAWRVG